MSTATRRATGRAKTKKQSSKKSTSSSVVGQIVDDEYHNQSLPCCRLLQDVARDIFPSATAEDTASADDTLTRPSGLLGHMIRKILLDQRQQEQSSQGNSEPSSSKKKKKKKKKKSNKSAAGTTAPTEATAENDSPAMSSTASQDSQSQDPVSPISPEQPDSQDNSNIFEKENQPSTSNSGAIHPVDKYLDRVLMRQQEKEPPGESLPENREIDAFVQYLNEKLRDGVSIAHAQIEAASQSISCPTCNTNVKILLQQDLKQPIILNPIQFHGCLAGESQPSKSNGEANNGDQRHHHTNGLEVPILNQKPEQAQAQAESHDFDYVALEEGTNPAGTMMEIQANVDGIPYFHPRMRHSQQQQQPKHTTSAGSSSSGTTSKKQTKSTTTQQQQILEWQFKPSSASSSKQSLTWEEEGRDANQITVQDLHHVVRNVMIPLALPPDELMGAYTDLPVVDLQNIRDRAEGLEQTLNHEFNSVHNEETRCASWLQELWKSDSENNLDFAKAPDYHDLDGAVHSLLEKAILDVVWDRLLWLGGSGNSVVSRPSVVWESVVAELTELSLKTITGVMKSVETFERELEDISNSQGAIPNHFVNQKHRVSYRSMIETKLNVVGGFLLQAEEISSQEILALYDTDIPPPPPSSSALTMPFRRKWFMQQEFCRLMGKQQNSDQRATRHSTTGNPPTASPTTQKSTESESHHWLRVFDQLVVDLLRGLLDLAKTRLQKRVYEIKEQHLTQCQKLVGLLVRVGNDVAPLVETNKSTGQSTPNLLDASLRERCQTLWGQIQQQQACLKSISEQNEEGSPVEELKGKVSSMAIDAIWFLRDLRKSLVVKYEPTPIPNMPFELVATMSSETRSSSFSRCDESPCFYDSLVSAAAIAESSYHHGCLGSGGQRRIMALILSLFYQNLSEHCSEWHAKLAEEELLTAMTSGDDVTSGGSLTMKKEQSENAPMKASKKSKKKKDKKSAGSEETISQIVDSTKHDEKTSTSSQDTTITTEPSVDDATVDKAAQGLPSQVTSEIMANDANEKQRNEGSQQNNGTLGKGRKKKGDKASESTGTGDISDANQVSKENDPHKDNDHFPKPDSKAGRTKPKNGKGKKKNDSAITSNDAYMDNIASVDRHMGVSDGAGVFHSAESYLVGRLSAVLKQTTTDASNRKGIPKGGGVIVI